MSLSSSPQQPYRRLKLVMSTPDQQVSQGSNPSDYPVKQEASRSSSPTRPSYSPVTPTLSQSSANGPENVEAETEWMTEPSPLPVSLDENPDAIALQATLSLLQMQRQQSLKDIRDLNRTRQEALEHPDKFVEDLRSGKLSKPAPMGVSLDSDIDDSEDETPNIQDGSRFGKLPTSQNVARCPPIEWSKYKVVGESLDRLHQLQRQNPGSTDMAVRRGHQTQAYEPIAPYRPFSDKLDPLPPSNDSRNYDR